jgi:hypothetical protein
VLQELGRLTVTHFESQELVNALFSGRGQPVNQLGLKFCVGILLRWRSNDILHLRSKLVVELRDYVVEFGFLVADTSQTEMCLNLGEPQGWSFCPEWREPNCGYLCTFHSSSGSPNVSVDVDMR